MVPMLDEPALKEVSPAAKTVLNFRVAMCAEESFCKCVEGEIKAGTGLDGGLGELKKVLLEALSA